MKPETIESYRSILATGKRGEVVKAGNELIAEIERLQKKAACKVEIPTVLSALGQPFESAWKDFTADRRERRKAPTTRAAEILLNRLSERPQRAVEALRTAIEKGWVSFQWDWLDRNGTLPGGGKRGEYAESKELPSGTVVRIGGK